MAKTYKIRQVETRTLVEIYGPRTIGLKKVYAFSGPELAQRWIEYQQRQDQTMGERREARKLARRAAMAQAVNPFQTGEILYNSWGWEQTNIDWYQVIGVKGMAVTLRKLQHALTETGFMCGNSLPLPGQFVESSEPFTKRVQVYIDYNGKPGHAYIKAEFGSFSKWDGKPERCSWYA